MELQNRAKTIFLCARNTILSSHGDIMKVDCVVQKGVGLCAVQREVCLVAPEPHLTSTFYCNLKTLKTLCCSYKLEPRTTASIFTD